jgi:hypothetical protein
VSTSRLRARLESNQRPLLSQSSALSAELRACVREPPAGVEPAPRPYKGRVLAVDTTEALPGWRRWESNSLLPRCKRGALPQASPGRTSAMRTGGVEPPQPLCMNCRRQGYSLLSSPMLSVRVRRATDRTRTGTARLTTSGAGRYTTVTMTNGDDRTRTGGLSPDKRVLCSSELRPLIARRTHLAGRSRTCDLRFPKPGGWPTPPQPVVHTPGGARTRSFRVESPASSPFRPRGREAPAAGIEPAPRD